MADIAVTVLAENTAGGRDVLAEHGLSLWIELGASRVLFDTGQGRVLQPNASSLGVSLAGTDAIVLSHGHYDHTGGLGDVLQTIAAPVVYAHPAAFEPKYSRSPDGRGHDAGISDFDRRMVQDLAEVVLVEEPAEIFGRLRLTGPVPRITDFENTDGAFFKDRQCTEPDDLIDDQAAFIETPAGAIVILGCAHAGVVNTLRYVQGLTGGKPIHTVLGGMHLLRASARRMDRTVSELRRMGVQRLLPCHCTGPAATARLWHEFFGRCEACPAGTRLELEY